MSIKALSSYTYYSRYSRFNTEKKRRETWEEAVGRVYDMHREKYAKQINDNPELGELINFAESMQVKKRVLAAQRSLQFAGAPIKKHELKLFNCLFTHINRSRVFAEVQYSLLCGCFHPDTEVLTASGVKRISEITLSDKVCTYDIESKTYEYVSPIVIHENETVESEKLLLEFENGFTVKCTENHEFLTHNRGWAEAKDLTENDDIVNQIGDFSNVIKKIKLEQDSLKYWDLTIPKTHNYVLRDGTVVHNCGVGFSVQKQHVKLMPNIVDINPSKEMTYTIADSIEGWSDAIDVLFASFQTKSEDWPQYANKKIVFDYSLIRPEGTLIAGQFKAPGPNGLRAALDKIYALIVARINSESFKTDEFKNRLRPIDCYDLIMHISDAVLSGGIRRAATLCLFSHDDDEMLTAKTGRWYIENPQRGRSNNSAALLKGGVTAEEFGKLMKSTKEFGEPGFIWMDDLDIGYNPCVTGDTQVALPGGDSTSMKDLVNRLEKEDEIAVMSYDIANNVFVEDIATAGIKTRDSSSVIQLTLEDGRIIKLTPSHKIMTKNRGYVEAGKLTINDDIVVQSFNKELFNNTVESTEVKYINSNNWTRVLV